MFARKQIHVSSSQLRDVAMGGQPMEILCLTVLVQEDSYPAV